MRNIFLFLCIFFWGTEFVYSQKQTEFPKVEIVDFLEENEEGVFFNMLTGSIKMFDKETKDSALLSPYIVIPNVKSISSPQICSFDCSFSMRCYELVSDSDNATLLIWGLNEKGNLQSVSLFKKIGFNIHTNKNSIKTIVGTFYCSVYDTKVITDILTSNGFSNKVKGITLIINKNTIFNTQIFGCEKYFNSVLTQAKNHDTKKNKK